MLAGTNATCAEIQATIAFAPSHVVNKLESLDGILSAADSLEHNLHLRDALKPVDHMTWKGHEHES